MPSSVLYIASTCYQRNQAGIRVALAEAGDGGEIVMVFVHDPSREENLREALSSAAFVGLKQVESVANAAWESVEACARAILEEAHNAIVDEDVHVTTQIARGDTVEVIRDLVRTSKAHKVVVCSREKSVFGRLFSRKLSKVLEKALKIPVIAVGPNKKS